MLSNIANYMHINRKNIIFREIKIKKLSDQINSMRVLKF